MSYIGATGLTEYEERFDTIEQEIDSNATYINTLVGIPDPIHLGTFGINVFNPSLYGLVERAEVNISALQVGEDGLSTDLSALTTQVEGIQTEVTAIQGEITALEGQITVIDGDLLFLNTFTLPAMVSSTSAAAVLAADALVKANKSLSIWDESGDNVYHKKVGNVGIGTTFGSVLNNKMEVGGSVNISAGSKYKINNVNLAYSDLSGTPPVSSKWTNATDVATNIYYSTGNVGIGVTSAINNKLEVGGSINIPTGSKYKINNVDLSYNDLTNKLTQGTNISIVNNVINNTYELPTATSTTLGSVRPDNSTITISNGILSAVSTSSGGDIFLNGSTNNRSYGWTGSTSLLGRVGVAGTFAIGSLVEDVVLRSQGRLLLQSGTNNPALTIETTTNNILVRNSIGIGTTAISSGSLIDVGGFFKVAFNAPVDALTLTSTGVQVNNTLNVSSGFNNGGIIRFGGFSDDSSLDLATIQNREYATNKSELLLFKGDNIEGLTGVDRIRLRAGAIAFDTFSADATTSATTENIRMYIQGNGGVGIGTIANTNGVLLDVNGVIESRFSIGANNIFYFKGVANSDINRVITAGTFSTNSAVNDMVIRSTNKLVLQSGTASPAIVIDTANNVGIGTTNPTALLDIVKSVVNTGSVDVLNLRVDANWGIKIAQNYTGAGNIQYELIHRYNTINYTSLIFKGNDTFIPEVLQIGSITGGAVPNTIRFRVYASTTDGTAAIFKHPNDTQGIGIKFDGIYGTNANQNVNISTTGTGTINLSTGGTNRLTIGNTGIVSFTQNVWHRSYDGTDRFYLGNLGPTYIKGASGTSIVFRNSSDQDLVYMLSNGNTQFLASNGSVNVNISSFGDIDCWLVSIGGSGMDYVGVADVGSSGTFNYRRLRGILGTFTGFHRCYIEDELFNEENVDIFKNQYVGRIVISTGKIKTDLSQKKKKEKPLSTTEPIIEDITENEETTNEPIIEPKETEDDYQYDWETLEGKEGITIEDALPIVQLSRVRKDKRIYGVLGNPNRNSNNKSRIIINGCGEGAICVANTNGNIENGDYIQTSDLLGYGEKQDDDLHRNYTIAKAVMDCNFELDNPNYECKELSSGVRVAMIACVYKAS